MSIQLVVAAGVVPMTVALAVMRRRQRQRSGWFEPSTSAKEGYAQIRARLEHERAAAHMAAQATGSTTKLLAHPLRHRLLGILNERVASPQQLASDLGLPIPNISQHVDMLLDAGAIELAGTQRRRGVKEHFYRGAQIACHSDDEWAALDTRERRQITEANIQRMVTDLLAAAGSGGFEHARSHQSWVHFELDERGFNEVADVLERALDRVLRIRDQSQRRLEKGTTEVHTDSEVVIAHFLRPRPGSAERSPRDQARARA